MRAAPVILVLATVGLADGPADASAQVEGEPRRIFGIEATPAGALPPLALPMPASRNHNYWVWRFQTGARRGRSGSDLLALAGGLDLQYRGGSIFGATAGWQSRDCEAGTPPCDGHPFFGTRARFNVFTGGPTIGSFIGDYSANTTLGAEIGFGWAPNAAPGYDACTLDVGVPFSVAMLQTFRLVAFVMPTGSIELRCSGGSDVDRDFIINLGLGIQQLWLRGLDLYIGFQRIVRDDTGIQLGISLMYVHLP